MAQAGIALAKIPLASPQPTAPPHPRDLARKLFQRQQPTAETCGWVDGQPVEPDLCALGSICAYNTAEAAAFCCDSASFPTFCPYATTCYDSTDVTSLCTSTCLDNTAVNKCTSAGLEYCLTKLFSYSSLSDVGYMTAWDCTSEPGETLFVYDTYNFGALASDGMAFSASVSATAAASTAVNYEVSYLSLGPSYSGSTSTSASLSPTTTSTTPLIATVTAAPVPSHQSGLSGGAIAGIVVGTILLLVIALGMFLLYRYFKGRKPPPPPPPQLTHDTTKQPISMATVQQGSPTLSNQPSNFTMPSNAPLYSPPMNELSPDESKVGSYPTSHSAVGAFPQFSVQHGGQPPASPRTEFGSMTPVHAPDVSSEYTFVPKGPQQ